MKIKRISFEELFKYLYILLLLFCTGTPIFSLYTPIFNVICLLISLSVLFIKKIKPNRNNLILTVAFIISFVASALINFDTDINAYLGYIVPVFSGLIGAELLHDDFAVKFIRIVVCMAAVSLVGYAIGILFPNFILQLPIIEYRSFKSLFYIQIYEYDPNWMPSLVSFHRNCGWYREPGIYATVLIIALVILVCGRKNIGNAHDKEEKIYEIILLLALMTTFSTSGIIAGIVLVLAKGMDIKTLKGNNLTRSILGLIVGSVYLYGGKNIIFSKFVATSDSYISYYERLKTTMLDLKIFEQHSLFGVGITKYEALSEGTVNSYTLLLACFGFFSFAIFLYMIFLFLEKNCRKNRMILGMIALLVVFSQQVIVIFPLVYVVLFNNKLINNYEMCNS